MNTPYGACIGISWTVDLSHESRFWENYKKMKKYLLMILVVIMALAIAVPAFADESHDCSHDGVTIESLHHCVHHAAEMGHISKPGIAASLIAKLNAAQAAYDKGNSATAVNILNAFISQVNAQSGKSIDPQHAGHLINHAMDVISHLSS